MQHLYRSSVRGGDVYKGFGGLNLADRLVQLDGVAHLHQPLHQLRLLQPFTKIGQQKLTH